MRRDVVADLRRNLPYAEGASGIAVALGGKVVGIDIFDKPATCKAVWARIVESLLLDALEMRDSKCRATESDVSVQLYMVRNVRSERNDSVGLGKRWGGSKAGWRWKVSDDQVTAIREMKAAGRKVTHITSITGLSRPTVYRVLRQCRCINGRSGDYITEEGKP